MSLIDLVRRTIRKHDLVRRDTRVVVALSGGSDSVALAHLTRELDAAGDLTAAGAAHFNHQLRPTADRDERLCAELARAFGWPIVIDRADVGALARSQRRSLEDAARTARHAFFERARAHWRRRRRARAHARRPGRDVSASPAARRRIARPRGDAPAQRRPHPAAARLPPPRSARVSRRAARRLRRGRVERRRQHSPQPRARRARAAARRSVQSRDRRRAGRPGRARAGRMALDGGGGRPVRRPRADRAGGRARHAASRRRWRFGVS